MTNDIDLLHNLKKKNELEKIIKTYTPYVSVIIYNTIGRITTREDVEEAIADVFYNLWRNADKIDISKGCIRSYVAAVARNTAKNKLRYVHIDEELSEGCISNTDDPEQAILKSESEQELLDMIMALGEQDNEIFLRYYYYNEKIKTISNVMNINISTVKSKLFRGKEKLKHAVKERRF